MLLRTPADCDPLVFQFSTLGDLLAARSCSHATRRRYDPARAPLTWWNVCPPVADLMTYIGAAPLEVAKVLVSTYMISTMDVREYAVLGKMCERGDLDAARWIAGLFKLDAHDGSHALHAACAHGHLAVAMWLVDRFDLTSIHACPPRAFLVRSRTESTTVSLGAYYTLQCACWNGHLAVVQWFVDRFYISEDEIRADSNYALRYACYGGHLAVVQWLVSRFDLTADDIRVYNNWALSFACNNGHLTLVKWLVRHFGLTAADIRADCNWALRHACGNGHLDTVRWIVRHFKLTADDGNCALRFACENGHLPIAQWLTHYFKLTAADIGDPGSYALFWAHKRGHPATVAWIKSHSKH